MKHSSQIINDLLARLGFIRLRPAPVPVPMQPRRLR